MKILAIDDSDLVRDLLDGTLPSLGYRDVSFAATGEEAVEILDRAPRPFQCFLLDIQMPGMDGIELCRHIRACPQYARTPIIMLTSMRDKQHIDAAFQAGATEYVTKPFEVTELGARLRTAEMLVREQQTAQDNAFVAEALKEATQASHALDLGAAVEIEDVAGVTSALALQNYLLQLSRGGYFSVCAVGFHIEGVEHLHRHATATEFRYMLTDVAEAIADSLSGTNFLMAYFGGGTFVAVLPKRNAPFFDELELNIRHAIEQMELAHDDGRPMEVRVAVGERINPGLLWRDAEGLLLEAIAAAQPTHRAGRAAGNTRQTRLSPAG